jgi:hypothetical protein
MFARLSLVRRVVSEAERLGHCTVPKPDRHPRTRKPREPFDTLRQVHWVRQRGSKRDAGPGWRSGRLTR